MRKDQVETAKQGNDLDVVDERKVDQVVAELEKYRVDVAGVQETKWFGSGVYRVAGSVVFASGRPVPDAGAVKQRGEACCLALLWRHGDLEVISGKHGTLGWCPLL